MGLFKRICFLIYSLAGVYFFGMLAASMSAALQIYIIAAFDLQYVRISMIVAGSIVAFGCIIILLRALFTKNRKVVYITRDRSNQVSVTRTAIASQATHLIEETNLFKVSSMRIQTKKYGHVRVSARIEPRVSCDLIAAGEELHNRLQVGLKNVVGDNVDAIKLEFSRAHEYADYDDIHTDIDDEFELSEDEAMYTDSYSVHTSAEQEVQDVEGGDVSDTSHQFFGSLEKKNPLSPADTSEITVSMSHYSNNGASAQPEDTSALSDAPSCIPDDPSHKE